MSISGTSGPSVDVPSQLGVRVQKLAQDQAKREGEQAVALIEQASAPAVGANGEGRVINTYA